MPTLELVGFSKKKTKQLIDTLRLRLNNLSFCKDIVFVKNLNESIRVIGWGGDERPFIRVLTRSDQRAGLIKKNIIDLVDVEVVIIQFYPKL